MLNFLHNDLMRWRNVAFVSLDTLYMGLHMHALLFTDYICFCMHSSISVSVCEVRHARMWKWKSWHFSGGSVWPCQRAEWYVSTGRVPQCACQSMGRPKGEGQEAAPTNLTHPSSWHYMLQSWETHHWPVALDQSWEEKGGDRTRHPLKTHCSVYYN